MLRTAGEGRGRKSRNSTEGAVNNRRINVQSKYYFYTLASVLVSILAEWNAYGPLMIGDAVSLKQQD